MRAGEFGGVGDENKPGSDTSGERSYWQNALSHTHTHIAYQIAETFRACQRGGRRARSPLDGEGGVIYFREHTCSPPERCDAVRMFINNRFLPAATVLMVESRYVPLMIASSMS